MNINGTMAVIRSNVQGFFEELGISDAIIPVDRPADFRFGDMSTNVALRYAKVLKTNPVALAEQIVAHLSDKHIPEIAKIEVVKPGFINIFFTQAFYADVLKEILEKKSDFGKNEVLKDQKWVVEHTSPNPNKAMHLGHLRNNLVGMGLVRLLEWNGAEVVSDAVDNDRGIAIAKLMWGFLVHMRKGDMTPIDVSYWVAHPEEWFTPLEKETKPDVFVTNCYVLGETDFKADPKIEQTVRNLVIAWEAKDEAVWKLWAHVLHYAYEGIEGTLSRLGNHWDKVWHEHEHYQEGKDYVEAGLSKGVFKKLEDGAILTDLTSYDISDTILLKNDGTSLYITQDIALTALKKKFYGADKLVWVIGPEQSLAMQQLFAVCEQLEIGKVSDFAHVTYGYVGLKGEDGGFKKMSSRAGTVVLIDDIIDNVKEKILARETNEKHKDPENLEVLSEKLALAAVKFSLLRSERTQDLVFDVDRSIETSGDSGIYVLYAYVRTQSILRKKLDRSEFVHSPTEEGQEGDLVKLLMFFPEVVSRSREDLSVHHIAQYLLEVCSAFGTWYGKEVILDGSDREDYKLAITECVGITIKNGLDILGIGTVDTI